MLGRKSFTQQEIDRGRSAAESQLTAYRKITASNPAADPEFEELYFTTMLIALDRPYVHRVRMVTGKDTNPLNEVELLVDSLLNHDGVLQGINAIKYLPEQSVLKLAVGDRIRLTADSFEKLAAAFFTDLQQRFGES